MNPRWCRDLTPMAFCTSLRAPNLEFAEAVLTHRLGEGREQFKDSWEAGLILGRVAPYGRAHCWLPSWRVEGTVGETTARAASIGQGGYSTAWSGGNGPRNRSRRRWWTVFGSPLSVAMHANKSQQYHGSMENRGSTMKCAGTVRHTSVSSNSGAE